jgi:hypothetical protein
VRNSCGLNNKADLFEASVLYIDPTINIIIILYAAALRKVKLSMREKTFSMAMTRELICLQVISACIAYLISEQEKSEGEVQGWGKGIVYT